MPKHVSSLELVLSQRPQDSSLTHWLYKEMRARFSITACLQGHVFLRREILPATIASREERS